MLKRGLILIFLITGVLLTLLPLICATASNDESSFYVTGDNCSAGWRCKDSNTIGYQNYDCSWGSNIINCPYGCMDGACQNQTCSSGWKCKDSSTRAFQTENCSWHSAINCPYGCDNGACKDIQKTCVDSDGGQKYYTKGYINHTFGIIEDFCIDGTNLFEMYCNGDEIANVTHPCPNGCMDGSCQKYCHSVIIGQNCQKTCKKFWFIKYKCRTECFPIYGTVCEEP